jgi:hypothetical protein
MIISAIHTVTKRTRWRCLACRAEFSSAPEGISSKNRIRGRGCLRQTGEERPRTVVARTARDGIPNAATDAAFDGDPDTFWSAPMGPHHAILEADFRKPVNFDHALTMEWLNDGQHIEHFELRRGMAERGSLSPKVAPSGTSGSTAFNR